MLLEFTVANYRSIKCETVFSMYASEQIDRHKDSNLITIEGGQQFVKTAVIYGANASGKSNLLESMGFFRHIVVNSIKLNERENIIPSKNYPSFQLNLTTISAPIKLEVTFLENDIYYRYGFSLDANKIHEEWLYRAEMETEKLLFHRSLLNDGTYNYDVDNFPEAKGHATPSLLENTLLLSYVAKVTTNQDSVARQVMNWIKDKLNVISGVDEDEYKGFTYSKLEDEEFRKKILQFLSIADVGIKNVFLSKTKIMEKDLPSYLSKELREFLAEKKAGTLFFTHKVFDEDGQAQSEKNWGDSNESEGTKKLFALSGPIIETLDKGETLIIDELDAKLHPMMMRFILGLFNSKEYNPRGAQLIFATHDTNLLTPRFFRADQIWFTEKNYRGETELYSLADYSLEDNANFSQDYFQGKYGAVPFIGDLQAFCDEDVKDV